MNRHTATARINSAPFPGSSIASDVIAVRLTEGCKAEALEFLSQRPLHTVSMAGFIRDNGIVSAFNRGSFYGCRNRRGELEGIALIGHATLMETRTDRALQMFADLARQCTSTHMIMGEEERISEFWAYYREGGQDMRLACREIMMELTWPLQVREEVPELNRARLDHLDLIVPVQAEMAFEEAGVNPLEVDALGFRERCARRIEQGRSWSLVANGKLMFKAEVIAETADTVYLEGVWVTPDKRGTGYGLRCMSQLARTLLAQAKSIVLFVNAEKKEAQHFYSKAGFKPVSSYDTIFLV